MATRSVGSGRCRTSRCAREPGEAIGLIGANGSGKTTLLRLVNRVMYPYAGRVSVHGRVGALIEIRAGLHPELRGSENIYFFGSLLGLRRSEIAAHFDDIVAFAELEHAIDRQVKFYSSGMQMRLGFAAASFLDPAILLVDEVLAVGDSAFQQRCLARLRDLLIAGTTLVFVSHDLAAVEATCRRAIWLDGGVVRAEGSAPAVVGAYRESVELRSAASTPASSNGVSFPSALVRDVDGGPPRAGGEVTFDFVIDSATSFWGLLCFGITEDPVSPIFVLRREFEFGAGGTRVRCSIDNLPVAAGRYWLWAGIYDRTGAPVCPWYAVGAFDVAGATLDVPPPAIVRRAPIYVGAAWEMERV